MVEAVTRFGEASCLPKRLKELDQEVTLSTSSNCFGEPDSQRNVSVWTIERGS